MFRSYIHDCQIARYSEFIIQCLNEKSMLLVCGAGVKIGFFSEPEKY